MRKYSARICAVCKQKVSSNGLAWHSHMETHVREGRVRKFTFREKGRIRIRYELTDRGML